MRGAIGSQLHGDFLVVLFLGGTALVAALIGYVGLTRATYRLFAKRVFGTSPGPVDDRTAIKWSLGALAYAWIAVAIMLS